MARKALRRADKIIAISRFTRDEILKKVPGLSIEVIAPGLDNEEFILARAKPVSEKIKNIQPYILSVGMIRWRKGYKRSIRAFARVAEEFPQMKYVVVGKRQSEKYFYELQEIIRELRLESKVLFQEAINSREELLGWYRGAELFCLFSENIGHDVEGFGMVFLEAAAMGLPVVGIGDCGVEDAVAEGKNGLLVRSRDPEKFAETILSILRDPEKKRLMSEESKKFAEGFSWKQKIQEYQKIYSTLLAPQ
jgi:phosphatidylinositol alpha-1,6-mannosyltransferase